MEVSNHETLPVFANFRIIDGTLKQLSQHVILLPLRLKLGILLFVRPDGRLTKVVLDYGSINCV